MFCSLKSRDIQFCFFNARPLPQAGVNLTKREPERFSTGPRGTYSKKKKDSGEHLIIAFDNWLHWAQNCIGNAQFVSSVQKQSHGDQDVIDPRVFLDLFSSKN